MYKSISRFREEKELEKEKNRRGGWATVILFGGLLLAVVL